MRLSPSFNNPLANIILFKKCLYAVCLTEKDCFCCGLFQRALAALQRRTLKSHWMGRPQAVKATISGMKPATRSAWLAMPAAALLPKNSGSNRIHKRTSTKWKEGRNGQKKRRRTRLVVGISVLVRLVYFSSTVNVTRWIEQ